MDSNTMQTQEKPSIIDLVKSLRDDTATLLRQEVVLAKKEMSEKATRLGRNAAYIAIGAGVAFTGILFLLLSFMNLIRVGLVAVGLAESIALWLAPLIMGVLIGLVGYGFIQKAINTFKQETLTPEKTIGTLKDDKNWLKEKMK